MQIFRQATWEQHAHPWSVWTRALSVPVLIAVVWYRAWWLLLAIGAFLVFSPRMLVPPERMDRWASKSVLGERIWTRGARRDLPALLCALMVPFTAAALWFAWRRELWPVVLSTTNLLALKLWFLDRMVALYERSGEAEQAAVDALE